MDAGHMSTETAHVAAAHMTATMAERHRAGAGAGSKGKRHRAR
jgi:hypothetical protein